MAVDPSSSACDTRESLRATVDRWFDEYLAPLAAVESTMFASWRDEVRGPLIVYGAGGLGRKLAKGLRAEGIHVEAFCDTNRSLHGTTIDDLEVMAPAHAVRCAGHSGGFVITTWSQGRERNNADIRAHLRGLGASRDIFFPAPFWALPDRFLPHYRIDLPSKLLAARSDVIRCADLLDDPASRSEFFTQLRMLATTTFDEQSYATPGETYFPDDLLVPGPDEAFVDCGAFDGDTLASLLKLTQGKIGAYWGFEPDPATFQKLQKAVGGSTIDGRQQIRVFPYAVGNRRSTVSFSASGDVVACIIESGGVEVECHRLDDVLAGESPTFLKMDIEGFELAALEGAESLLRRSQPTCAVCVYHTQDHLWSVPLRLAAILPDHSMHLRAHSKKPGFDIVCYALPPDR